MAIWCYCHSSCARVSRNSHDVECAKLSKTLPLSPSINCLLQGSCVSVQLSKGYFLWLFLLTTYRWTGLELLLVNKFLVSKDESKALKTSEFVIYHSANLTFMNPFDRIKFLEFQYCYCLFPHLVHT